MATSYQYKHLFEALGIPPTTNIEEIRAAYRRSILQSHPDKSRSHRTAQNFIAAKAAWEILKDADFSKEQHNASKMRNEGGYRQRHDQEDLAARWRRYWEKDVKEARVRKEREEQQTRFEAQQRAWEARFEAEQKDREAEQTKLAAERKRRTEEFVATMLLAEELAASMANMQREMEEQISRLQSERRDREERWKNWEEQKGQRNHLEEAMQESDA